MTPPAARKAPPERLVARIERTGAELREALVPLTRSLGGSPPRPARLIARLGIDKSLASRLLRALRSDSDLELVHRIPSPTGLRIFLDRAVAAGTEESSLAAARTAVEKLQDLIEATPGGQSTIDAQISESSIEVREKREHVSKQAVHKAMSFLLGYYCEALTTTLILVPARNGRTIDGVEIHQRHGMRRLRPNTPLALLSVSTPPDDEPPDDTTWIEPLDSGTELTDPTQLLLPEFSTDPIPELDVLVEPDHLTLVLDEDDPSLENPVSLTSAFRIRNAWPRVRAPEEEHVVRGYVLHMPCQTLVRDLFISDEICAGSIPEITFQLQNPGGRGSVRPEGLRKRISSLDLTAPIEQLGAGPRGHAVRGLPEYGRIVSHVFERIGRDPARFRGYRCAISYPVPLVEMLWWMPLPEGPDTPSAS